MANIMSLKQLRNKPSRNGFDLSFKKNFTAKAGELLPIMCKEVLPGDSFTIDLSTFMRTQPLNTAAFARMRQYYDFYFVPYDLLWNKANTVLTQMFDNPQHAVSGDPSQNFTLAGEMPYITCSQIANYLNTVAVDKTANNYFGFNRGLLSAKLLEYLGYGNFLPYAENSTTTWSSSPLTSNMQLNIFGLLAYQKIYADYFRDSQWEKISPSTFNVDYLSGVSDMNVDVSSANFRNYYNWFDMRYCNWQKDLYHGVVPQAQYGDVAAVPINLSGAVLAAASNSPNNQFLTGEAISPHVVNQYEELKIDLANNPSFNVASNGLSILLLRQYEFLQKWKEITQSGNKDYAEQVQKHWNVSAGDGFSEMCTYLGGIDGNLDINEVVNNNITGDNAADIAGKGSGVSRGSIKFDSNGRYGLLMCIYHCLPVLDYTTDIVEPAFTKINATDYAIPEFDRVGMQGVNLLNMSNAPSSFFGSASRFILGYAPRYIDYKTSVDYSVGAFKRTLKSWVMSYDNQSVADAFANRDETQDPDFDYWMNYTFFKVHPNSVDPIFAVEADSTVDTDEFLCSSFFDIKVVRNLDTDGLPY